MAYTYYVLLILVSTSIAFGEERRDDDNTSTLEDNVQLLQELVYRQGSDIGRLVEDSTKVVLMMLMQQQQEQREQLNGITQQQQEQHEQLNGITQQQQEQREQLNGITQQQQEQHEQMNGLERQQQEMQELLQDNHRQLMMNTAPVWCRGNQTGLTTIYIRNQPLVVPCDGKESIVILRRIDGLHFTDRMWDDFKNGFGDKMRSFWIGLDTIHLLTKMYACSLKVELEDWEGETRVAHYKYVHIEDENSGYRLYVSNYEGNAGDSLALHNGHKFSTTDRDQDASSFNCAKNKHAGWWFNSCSSSSNLAGQYFSYDKHNTSADKGLYWVSWRGSKYSLKRAQMTLILR